MDDSPDRLATPVRKPNDIDEAKWATWRGKITSPLGIGLIGLAALTIETIALSDIIFILQAILLALLMGLWALIALSACRSVRHRKAVLALKAGAVLYFMVSAFLIADILANGNSTAAAGFFIIPIISSVIALPYILIIKAADAHATKRIAK